MRPVTLARRRRWSFLWRAAHGAVRRRLTDPRNLTGAWEPMRGGPGAPPATLHHPSVEGALRHRVAGAPRRAGRATRRASRSRRSDRSASPTACRR
jgi:hypothetical protein